MVMKTCTARTVVGGSRPRGMPDAPALAVRILKPRPHGFIDYAMVLLFAAAPTLFGFDGTPQILCYVLAAVYLGTSLLTAYPLGALKVIPFPVHGAIEAILAPLFALFPWLMGFSGIPAARNFFLVAAGAVALLWLVTDYKLAQHEYPAQRSSHV
jgi:hypothetical protein